MAAGWTAYVSGTGKTGRRQLRILSPYYTDYLKKWIELHPKGTLPSSYLIYSKKTGFTLVNIYTRVKTPSNICKT